MDRNTKTASSPELGGCRNPIEVLQNRGDAANTATLQLLPGSSSWDPAPACSVLATGISPNSHCHLPAVTNLLLHCDTSRSLTDPPGQGDPLPQVTALHFEKFCESLSGTHKPRRMNYICYTRCQCLKVKLLLLGCHACSWCCSCPLGLVTVRGTCSCHWRKEGRRIQYLHPTDVITSLPSCQSFLSHISKHIPLLSAGTD